MKTFIAKSSSLVIPFDSAAEELRISGTIVRGDMLPRLTENDVINNEWMKRGAHNCDFNLTALKSANDSNISKCYINASLNFHNGTIGNGNGSAHLNPRIFEKIVSHLEHNRNALHFFIIGLGSSFTNKNDDSFTCKIQFEILHSAFILNSQ